MLTRIITEKTTPSLIPAAFNKVKPSFSAQHELIPSPALATIPAPPPQESHSFFWELVDLPRYMIYGPTEAQKAVKAIEEAASEKKELVQALDLFFQKMEIFEKMRKRPIATEVVANLNFLGETIKRATVTPHREVIILAKTDDEKYVLYYGKLNLHQQYEFTKYSEFSNFEILDTKENRTFIVSDLTATFPKSKEFPCVNGERTFVQYNPVYGRSPIGGSVL